MRTLSDFNPRPHEGDDRIYRYQLQHVQNFNPRPHEGDDPYCIKGTICPIIYFNPRPHEGDDGDAELFIGYLVYFNPRPHEGDDVDPRHALDHEI